MRMRILVMWMGLAVVIADAAALTPRWRAASRLAKAALAAADGVSWSVQTSGIDTNLRGVSAAGRVDSDGTEHIALWACGSNGVILLSTDLGKTWKRVHVAGGDALDFRSIVAFDANMALVMSSGEGDKSRIYKTVDGGVSWKLEFTDSRKGFFLDALACDGGCYALSDPIDGKFVIVATHKRGVERTTGRWHACRASRRGCVCRERELTYGE